MLSQKFLPLSEQSFPILSELIAGFEERNCLFLYSRFLELFFMLVIEAMQSLSKQIAFEYAKTLVNYYYYLSEDEMSNNVITDNLTALTKDLMNFVY